MPSGAAPGLGERLTLTLERFAAQGRAVGHQDGFAVLVERGLPGERVVVEISRVEPRHALARVVEVLAPAPGRVQPPCVHFALCAGCDLQQLEYPAQVAAKRQVADEQLRRIGGLEPPADWWVTPAPAPLEYRDKLEFIVVPEDGRPRPGFHGTAPGRTAAVERCRLAAPDFTRLAQAALDALAGTRAGARHGALPLRLTVQSGEAEEGRPALALTLRMATARAAEALAARGAALAEGLRAEVPALATLAVSAPPAARGEAPPLRVLDGPGALVKAVGAARYRVPLDAFFQVHPAQTEALAAHVVEQVRAHLPPGKPPGPRLLDLYCGAGLFALPLLALGYRVAGADASGAAVRAAAQAAQAACGAPAPKEGGFVQADLERPEALRELLRRCGYPAGVVLDPPRRGLAARLAADLKAARPALLVYVSCDSGTFARDAARLASHYALAALRGFDLFPQTHHLELVGTFTLRH
jgi:23S rRNA (uracil1939-C5)-methyltransferase